MVPNVLLPDVSRALYSMPRFVRLRGADAPRNQALVEDDQHTPNHRVGGTDCRIVSVYCW